MKVGIIQQANNSDIKGNINKLQHNIRLLASKGAELIVMQELHNGLYFCQTEDPDVFEQTETIPGPSTNIFGKIAKELGVDMEHYQTNHEGCLVDKIQEAYGNFDGIVINPAAYTHTSIAILDALKAVSIPAVEVHISDVSQREAFRQVSYAGMACEKTIMGLGLEGYRQAILYLKNRYNA